MRISKDFLRVAKREPRAGWARALRFWDTIAIIMIMSALVISCTVDVWGCCQTVT